MPTMNRAWTLNQAFRVYILLFDYRGGWSLKNSIIVFGCLIAFFVSSVNLSSSDSEVGR